MREAHMSTSMPEAMTTVTSRQIFTTEIRPGLRERQMRPSSPYEKIICPSLVPYFVLKVLSKC